MDKDNYKKLLFIDPRHGYIKYNLYISNTIAEYRITKFLIESSTFHDWLYWVFHLSDIEKEGHKSYKFWDFDLNSFIIMNNNEYIYETFIDLSPANIDKLILKLKENGIYDI